LAELFFIIDNPIFFDSSWQTTDKVIEGKKKVLPDRFLRQIFYFHVPPKKGEYTARFKLSINDGKWTDEISLPITVTADAPANYHTPTVVLKIKPPPLDHEPKIRVGINISTNFIQFRSYDDDYNVFENNKKIGTLPKGKFAILKFENGQQYFNGGDLRVAGNTFFHLEPVNNPHAVFYILNLKRHVKWVSSDNFNQYRGALEYRQGEVDHKMYAVNELLLEDYVKGMAEVGHQDEMEFVKANTVAFRNYAYIHIGNYPFFDVLGNTYDQLYLGFNSEKALPNVVQATQTTRGLMLTYSGTIVVTPYFGRSNGWTKSYSSVWGGSKKPWLVPVRAEYDAGYSRLGHGVGMSQHDANLRAKKQGLNYKELLKYYYTGVEIEKIYN